MTFGGISSSCLRGGGDEKKYGVVENKHLKRKCRGNRRGKVLKKKKKKYPSRGGDWEGEYSLI